MRRARRRRQRGHRHRVEARDLRQVCEIDAGDHVAIGDAIFVAQVLVLACVILGCLRHAHSRKPGFHHRHLVSAATEAIPAINKRHVKASHVLIGDDIHVARKIARRRINLAANRPASSGNRLFLVRANAFGEDADTVVHRGCKTVRVADDIVVQNCEHVPALRLGVGCQDTAAMQPLLFPAQRREHQRRAELALRQDAGGFHHGGDARSIVIRPGSVGGEIEWIGNPAVEVALDDDHAVRVGRPAQDGDGIGDHRRIGNARRGRDSVLHLQHFEAAAAVSAHLAELGFDPAPRRADAANVRCLVGQRVARSERHHLLDIAAQARLADLARDRCQGLFDRCRRRGRIRCLWRGARAGSKEGERRHGRDDPDSQGSPPAHLASCDAWRMVRAITIGRRDAESK